jgi:hypothetical protein
MSTPNTNKPIAEVVAAIDALDLEPIKFKVTCKEDGYGWSSEYADQMEVAYKRYLILLAKYPEATFSPTRDIDQFWHAHILDTSKYAQDCESTFGYFLHHFPYLGLRGEEDSAVNDAAGRSFEEAYAREFGESPSGAKAFCAAEAKKTFCAADAKKDFCAAGAKSFCAAEAKKSFCAANDKKAFCAAEKSFCAAAARADLTSRPRLLQAA